MAKGIRSTTIQENSQLWSLTLAHRCTLICSSALGQHLEKLVPNFLRFCNAKSLTFPFSLTQQILSWCHCQCLFCYLVMHYHNISEMRSFLVCPIYLSFVNGVGTIVNKNNQTQKDKTPCFLFVVNASSKHLDIMWYNYTYHEPKDSKLELGNMSTKDRKSRIQWLQWGSSKNWWRKFNWGEERVGQQIGRGKKWH